MPGESDDKRLGTIAKGLSQEPAYLLVYGLVLLVSGGAWATGLPPLWAAITTLGALGLGGFSIFLVERGKRSSLPVDSREQRARLSRLPAQENAIQGVLDGLVDNEADTTFVYSSTLVERFIDYEGKAIEHPFTEEERQVTAIPDAHGISKVHSLMFVAGKQTRLHIATSRSFRAEDWDNHLILIGSKNANLQTERTLEDFNAPFVFNDDVSAIVEVSESTGGRWPSRPEDLEHLDYGIIVKLKIVRGGRSRIYLVLAGLGGLGTLACCHFLERRISELYTRFQDSPFGCVVSVNRDVGYTSVKEEKCKLIAPFSE